MINRVILVGNVGADPEVRTLESGTKMARIRLATTERVFNRESNESKEYTEWHTLIVWRGLADVVDKYIRKGSQLYIEGSLRTREWLDKENVKHYTTEINVSELKMLGRRADNMQQSSSPSESQPQAQPIPAYAATPAPQATPQQAAPTIEEDVDDLPF